MTPRSTYQRLLGYAGRIVVILILGFLILPAAVVTIAAFNDKAILSFPPQAWSWRWFERALAYPDFRAGFQNGLIVTAWSSSIALVIGAMFAFVIDRYQFALKRPIEGILVSPLVIPHFTVGLGFLILAAQIGWSRGFAVVVACHVVLVLPFVLRSVYVSLRNLDPSYEFAAASLGATPLPRAVDRHVAATDARPRQRLAVCRDPVLQRIHGVTVRDVAADANLAGCDVQLRARIRRSLDGGAVGDVYRGTAALIAFANRFLGLGKVLNIEQSH